MKIFAGFLIFFISLTAPVSAQNTEQLVSYELIRETLQRNFPGMYVDFLTISFVQRNEIIYPDAASFLIPSKILRKEYSDKKLEQCAAQVLEQLELAPACQTIQVGSEETYSWQAWPDKKVCKVTLTFGVGC